MHSAHLYYTDVDLLEDSEIESLPKTVIEAKLIASAEQKIVALELNSGNLNQLPEEKVSLGQELKVHKVNLEFDESTLEKNDDLEDGEEGLEEKDSDKNQEDLEEQKQQGILIS